MEILEFKNTVNKTKNWEAERLVKRKTSLKQDSECSTEK